MPQPNTPSDGDTNPASDAGRTAAAVESKAAAEAMEPTVSEAGGFANDPDDSTNPNEVIERHRRHLRP
jgi:hypothetical protein